MAITVNFGINSSDERYITKNVQYTKNNVQCDIYDPTNRIDPVLTIDNSGIDIADCNYMEIPDFGRKYFITDIVGEAGKMLTVHGHVDVLSTFDSEIRDCECIAERSTSTYNMYLQDNMRLFNAYTWNQYISLNSVGDPSILLISTV